MTGGKDELINHYAQTREFQVIFEGEDEDNEEWSVESGKTD